jgi:carboxyl-terminal processing protease
MMRLTVAKYYTPSTRCIQKPYDKGVKEYSEDIINRYNNGELTNADSIHFPDSLRYETLTLKRTVYGGGGIMPDIFIPLDTTKVSDLYAKLFRKGVIYQFTIDYMDKHRAEFETKYTNFEYFKNEFVMTDEMYAGLLKRAEKEKIEYTDEDKEKSFKEIELIFKALIARDLWNMSEYFQIVNPTDDTFNKAVEIISNPKEYKNNFKKK